MKATGIIRRIDELGRIVIPKEMRKSLRIKEGENLEIFVDSNDNIVLKKYSAIKNLEDLAQSLTEAINSFVKKNVIITDNDTILAVSGSLKKNLLSKPISEELESKILRREELLEHHSKKIFLTLDYGIEGTYTVSPIIVNGDSVGIVMIFSDKEVIDNNDFKLVQIAAKFLNNHLE